MTLGLRITLIMILGLLYSKKSLKSLKKSLKSL